MGLRVEGHTGREHQRAVMTVEAAAVRQQCEGGRGPARGAPASLSLPLSLARPARGGWGSGCTVASFTNHRAMKHCDGCRSASQRPRGAGWGRPVGCPSAQRPPLPSSRRPGAHSGHTKKETVAEAGTGASHLPPSPPPLLRLLVALDLCGCAALPHHLRARRQIQRYPHSKSCSPRWQSARRP